MPTLERGVGIPISIFGDVGSVEAAEIDLAKDGVGSGLEFRELA